MSQRILRGRLGRFGRRRLVIAAGSTVALLVLVAVLAGAGMGGTGLIGNVVGGLQLLQTPPQGIAKIKHVVIITQENRSFDSYFGTYPGADGIPMQDGRPSVCLPDPGRGGCIRPYHNPEVNNAGAPHSHSDELADVNGGAMDGFVAQAEKGLSGCSATATACQYNSKATDIMGYHDGSDLPNYWAYAQNFTLQDHLFAAASAWSLPAHLYLVSEWSAKCSKAGDPSSCVNELQNPESGPDPEIIRNTLIGKCQTGLDLQPCQDALKAAGISPDLAAEIDQLISASCKPTDSYPSCQAAVDAAQVPDALKKNSATPPRSSNSPITPGRT
ncbi:alkaline phosphatase family protein [Pseudarthrobacter sp. L19]|uniref:alkaline phosphatase family protein n=1 Tax=Pseudarthrobacter sp. L19 TaxID=3423951 RepID=UPI003D7BB0A8